MKLLNKLVCKNTFNTISIKKRVCLTLYDNCRNKTNRKTIITRVKYYIFRLRMYKNK